MRSEGTRKVIAVIGAGAAGMAAAVEAARAGASVHLFDRNDRIGRKLAATGNGRCNFTHEPVTAEDYTDGAAFAGELAARVTPDDLRAWFEGLGVASVCRSGYVYPATNQAATVVEALRLALEENGVTVHAGCAVADIRREASGKFVLNGDSLGSGFSADRVVIACGGPAGPALGGTESGYTLAKHLGHTVMAPTPALTYLMSSAPFCKAWDGVRVNGRVELSWKEDGQTVAASDAGELQLTKNGISGIPVFQVSARAARALESDPAAVSAVLSFWPEGLSEEAFYRRAAQFPSRSAAELLTGLLPAKLIPVICRGAASDGQTPPDAAALERLWQTGKAFTLRLTGTGGFAHAQVTAGGVPVEEVDPATMESRRCSGLYLAGEVLDVTGLCGGFNLHAAFSGGILAGRAAGA